MIRLGVFGAFDRFNYGDLLFPLILERTLGAASVELEWEYYGLISSDLSGTGGKPTKSISEFLKSKDDKVPKVLIIAGGEVLEASWTTVTSYLLPKGAEVALRGIRKIAGERISDLISRLHLRLNHDRPFVIGPYGPSGRMLVLYNAVGGSSLPLLKPKEKSIIAKELDKASYISVRDWATREHIQSLGINQAVFLAPDSGILISDIFKSDASEDDDPFNSSGVSRGERPFLCFQCSRRFASGREKKIAESLIRLCNDRKLSIVFVSIGLATGHEDQVAVRKIAGFVGDKVPVLVPRVTHIRQIATFIARSSVFVGTSLHGVITAMSYGVPFVGFTSEVSKLRHFLETWNQTTATQPIDIHNMNDAVDKALTGTQHQRQELSSRLKMESYKNFDRIRSVIQNAVSGR